MQNSWWRWVIWGAVLALVTLLMLGFRDHLDKAHVTLVYLLVVLAGTASGGRRLGLALAGTAFLLFDWFFLLPYYTLSLTNPLDWLVLIAFFVVSAVVAQMLHSRQVEATAARQRAAEVDRFAALGAETLNVARADQALAAIAEVIRATLELEVCRIHTTPAGVGLAAPADSLVAWAAQNGAVAIRQSDGTIRITDSAEPPVDRLEAACGVFLPLQVRGRTVGVLELERHPAVALAPAQSRFLSALAHYAALAVERARLEAEAGHVEALREADRLKDALLASVSHDLRTPLTTIKALAHDIAATDDRATVIEEEADRLNRMVASLLDLTLLKGGTLALRLEINAVDDLVAALIQRVSGALGGRELRVRLEDGGTLLVGRFDFGQALRILVNLVENAHKYASSDNGLDLTVRRTGGQIELALADRGPGVPPEESSRIFEPFYRPPGTPPDVGGAGLGLAISRQLARAQGGDLLYTPRPNGGSVFTLTLPAEDLPAFEPAF